MPDLAAVAATTAAVTRSPGPGGVDWFTDLATDELRRVHPEWLLSGAVTWRHQHVLDLRGDDVRAFVLERLDALLTEYPLAYLTWDPQPGPAHRGGPRADGCAVRRARRAAPTAPWVEIESCVSGGARVDLGILERVDRFWTSHVNDPLERQAVQRWGTLLLPPE